MNATVAKKCPRPLSGGPFSAASTPPFSPRKAPVGEHCCRRQRLDRTTAAMSPTKPVEDLPTPARVLLRGSPRAGAQDSSDSQRCATSSLPISCSIRILATQRAAVQKRLRRRQQWVPLGPVLQLLPDGGLRCDRRPQVFTLVDMAQVRCAGHNRRVAMLAAWLNVGRW